MSSPPPSSQGRSSDDPSCERGQASGWTPRLPVLLYEQRSSAVGHRRHDLARQSENRGLVRRAMPDDERPTAFGQLVQHTAERCAEDRRILLPQLRIGRAKRLQLAAARLLVGAPPPILTFERRPHSTTAPPEMRSPSAHARQASVCVARCAPLETSTSWPPRSVAPSASAASIPPRVSMSPSLSVWRLSSISLAIPPPRE